MLKYFLWLLCNGLYCYYNSLNTYVSRQLSPKKTWEGFIGGFFATIVFGILVSNSLLPVPLVMNENSLDSLEGADIVPPLPLYSVASEK